MSNHSLRVASLSSKWLYLLLIAMMFWTMWVARTGDRFREAAHLAKYHHVPEAKP